ncbi:DUF4214 domain-containing protein, partial [Massilia sp. BJB1822]|uniref:DUF4214 domain-containing protein n=1 Tax=Massilia sp. BJB1822 TaxID=2744470 RepID=UPI001592F66D
AQPDPDGEGAALPSAPETTRYLYDEKNHLRFVISAERRVAEMRYDSKGQRISSITHAATLDPALVGSTSADALATWANGLATKSKGIRTDYSYDVRGLLSSSTSYAALDDSGNGISDGSQSTVTYVYDQAGRLVKSIDAKKGSTSYAYDGAGRIIATRQPNEFSTRTEYNDVSVSRVIGGVALMTTQSTSTQYNGLVTVSTFDSEGKLVSVLERDANGNVIGETLYGYDDSGRPLWTEGPTGARSYTFYDGFNRKAADIDADGTYTEYVYNNEGQLAQLIRHAQPVNVAALAGSNPISSLTVQSLPRGAKPGDEVEYRGYDAAGRLVKSIDAGGYLTETRYDGQSRVTATIRYASPVSVSDPNKLPTADASSVDRISRRYYDKEGRLRATLDAESYLTEYNYDALGQVIETVAYAERTTSDLRPQGDAFREYKLYDGKGQLIATIDGDRYLTEMAYDANGQLTSKTRYAQSVNYTVGMRLADLRPAGGERQTVSYDYNAMRQLIRETAADGTTTTHTYDLAGNRTASTVAAASTDERGITRQYDARGLLLAELSGEGTAKLALAASLGGVPAVWNSYATKYTYNAAGLRTSMTEPGGNRTLYYYDRDGRLTHTVNAAGEVEGRQYNVLNRLEQATVYATRIDAARLATLSGGQNDTAFAALITGLASGDDASTRYFYDQRGLLTNQTDALGFTTVLHYDAFGQLDSRATQIDRAGSTLLETMVYNRRGELTATGADNSGQRVRTRTEYDAFGRVKQRIDANGKVTDTQYDGLGRQVIVKLPLGGSTTTSYDAFGRVLTQTDANGFTTRTTYDTQQRSITLTSPDGASQTVRNNRHGQQIGLTDGNGNTTTFEYDRDGKLLKTVNGLSQESRNVYDKAGQLFQSIDANGTVTEYRYDAANRVLSRTVDPTGLDLTTSYTYDTRGQVQTVTDPRGIVTRSEYDKKGQLRSITVDQNGLKLKTAFEYDGRGKTLSVTDPAGRVTAYEYDQLGRRTAEVTDPGVLALRTSYTYDPNGNVITRLDANRNLTRFSYDAENRVTVQIDGAGAVTRFDYDAAGHLTHTVTHAKALDLASLEPQIPTPRSVAGDIAWLLQRVAADAARDRNTYTVYSKDGKVRFSVDGAGAVTQFAYDRNGNLSQRLGYATAISLAGLKIVPSAEEISAALNQAIAAAGANPPTHRREIFGYDAANRLTISALALSKNGEYNMWAVTRNEYDANGNLIATRSLQNPYRVHSATAPKDKDVAEYCNNPQTASQFDAITRFAYDSTNRQIASAKALGPNSGGVMQWAVTAQAYDKSGNIVTRTEFAQALLSSALPVNPNAAAYAAWLGAAAANDGDRITRFGYDGANRQDVVVDAAGAITKRERDGSGNVQKTTRYANPALFLPRGALARDALNSINADAARDRIERAEYDNANRLRFSLDAEGYIQERRYDGLDRVLFAIAYDQPAPGATSIAAAAAARAGTANTTGYVFDAQGNITSVTDALQAKESYKYDALGNKTEFTNKLNNTWRYAYDGAGRMVLETSPQVLAYDSNGLLATWDNLGAPKSESLVTKLDYDALGNLLSRKEGYGSNAERSTEYRYDAAGRQTQTIRPNARIYDPVYDRTVGMGALGAIEQDSGLLITTVTYDALGNAVSNKDVGGKLSFKCYDAAGRVNYEVDAAGYVTSYERDAFGSATRMMRHAIALAPAAAGVLQRTTSEVQQQLSLSASEDRALENTYDKLGRVLSTREPSALIYDRFALGSSPYLTAAKTTRNEYNAYGEVQRRSVYGAAADGTPLTEAAVSRSYFNRRGQKVAEISALSDKPGTRSGYLSTYEYDAAGNLLTQVEYSTAFGNWSDTSYTPPGKAPSDRTTTFTYDALNRKRTETKVGVLFADNNGNANATLRDLSTSYTYDALGNQRSVTDALLGRTYSYYDVLGRVTAIAKTQLAGTDLQDGGNQLTEFKLNIHGDAVLRIEHELGAENGSVDANGYRATAPSSQRNRITATRYDNLGREMETLDAVQFMGQRRSTMMSYDEYGRLAKRWRAVSFDNVVESSYEINRYDVLGRLSEVWTPGNANVITGAAVPFTRKINAYNGFGEVTSTSVAAGDGPAVETSFARYDRAGRAWISNSGDGIDKIALYDAQGRSTAVMHSTSEDRTVLRRLGDSAAAVGMDKLVRTDTRYDLLGHVVDRRVVGDSRLSVLQRTGSEWIRVPLAQNQAMTDTLLVIGDSSDLEKKIIMRYRLAGSSTWLEAGAPRIQIVDGSTVFSTRGLAGGDYEYQILVQAGSLPPYERESGTLRLASDPNGGLTREIILLYMLLFNRAPEIEGLNNWLNVASNGYIRGSILQNMLLSQEAIDRFKGLDPVGVISRIYESAFNQTPAQMQAQAPFINDWARRYEQAAKQEPDSRGQVLADLLYAVLAYNGETGKLLENRSAALSNYLGSGGTDRPFMAQLMAMALDKPQEAIALGLSQGKLEGFRMQAIRTYIALFGRAPERAGIDTWVTAMQNGLSIEGMADALLSSVEAQHPWLYPQAGLTAVQYNLQLVKRAYTQMLGRDASAGELAEWGGKLNGVPPLSRGQFAVALIEKIRGYNGSDPAQRTDKSLFDNKVAVAYTTGIVLNHNLDEDGSTALVSAITSAATAQDAAKLALLNLQAQRDAALQQENWIKLAAGAQPLKNQRHTLGRMFMMFLRRTADRQGWDFYERYDPQKAEQWSDLARGFMESAEGRRILPNWRSMGNAEFVTALYTNAIGYLPASPAIQEEIRRFTAELASGTDRLTIAVRIADEMLMTPNLLPGDLVHKSLLDNRTAVAISVGQALDLNDEALQQNILQQVTASDMSGALKAAYDAHVRRVESLLQPARDAAGSAVAIADTLARTGPAGIAARAALNALAANPAAQKRLQCVQLYMVLLKRTATYPPDIPGLEFNLTENNVAIERLAQNFLDGTEGQGIFPRGQDAESFVKQVYAQMLGAQAPIPAYLLNKWVPDLTRLQASDPTARGRVALDIINDVLTHADAAPDAASAALIQARAGFTQRLVEVFGVVDTLTAQEISRLAPLVTRYDELNTQLAQATRTLDSANTAAGQATAAATQALAGANSAGDGLAERRLFVVRLYAALLQRTPSNDPPPLADVEGHVNRGGTPLQLIESFMASSEGKRHFPSGSTPQDFVTQLYQHILGRTPNAGEISTYVSMLASFGGNRPALTKHILDCFLQYTDSRPEELQRKKTWDSQVAGLLSIIQQQAASSNSAAKSSYERLQQLQRDIATANGNKAYYEQRVRDLSPAADKGRTLLALNSTLFSQVVDTYAAIRGDADFDGVIWQVQAILEGRASLDTLRRDLIGNHYPSDDTGFVLKLYKQVLGRAATPTQGEIDLRLNQLRAGKTRSQIAEIFMDSAEGKGNWPSKAAEEKRRLTNKANDDIALKSEAEKNLTAAINDLAAAQRALSQSGLDPATVNANYSTANARAASINALVSAHPKVLDADEKMLAAANAKASVAGLQQQIADLRLDDLTRTRYLRYAAARQLYAQITPAVGKRQEAEGAQAQAAGAYQSNAKGSSAHRITQLYFTLLNRSPSLIELQSWIGKLADGSITLGILAKDLLGSVEAKQKGLYPDSMSNLQFLMQLYRQGLGREMESSGQTFWLNWMSANNASREQMAVVITDSVNKAANEDTERFNKKTSDALKVLQTAAVSRAEIDAAISLRNEQARLTASRRDGPSAALMNGSPDAMNAMHITRLYIALLGRNPEPSGMRFWLDQIKTRGLSKEALAKSIVESEEGVRLYPRALSAADFVKAFFERAFARAPSEAELAKYGAQLAGADRGQVALNIIDAVLAPAGNDLFSDTSRTNFIDKVANALLRLHTAQTNFVKSLNGAIGVLNQAVTGGIVQTYNTPVLPVNGMSISGTRRLLSPDLYTVDRWGNVLSAADLRDQNYKAIYTYDHNNQLLTKSFYTLPSVPAPIVQNRYDALGRVVAKVDERNFVTSLNYDSNGYQIRELHQGEKINEYEVDRLGQRRLVRKFKSASEYAETSFTYDQLGRQLTSTSGTVMLYYWSYGGAIETLAGNIVERYTYDELGRRISTMNTASTADNPRNPGVLLSDPNLGTITRAHYDLSGNVTQISDGENNVTHFVYDALNRKIRELRADGLAKSWTYDEGRLVSHTDLGGNTTTYTHNASNQTLSAVSTVRDQYNPGVLRTQTIRYRYEDTTGQLTQIADEALNQISLYAYDVLGNRIREKVWAGNKFTFVQDQILRYDNQNRLGKIKSMVRGADYDLSYDYDNAGNRTQVQTIFNTVLDEKKTVTVKYDYDGMNRQTSVSGSVRIERKSGPWIKPIAVNSDGVMYDYNPVLTESGPGWADTTGAIASHTISYDRQGNRTGDNGEIYTYDALGRLSEIKANNVVVGYRHYDSAGRVISSLDKGEVRLHTYDRAGRLQTQRVLERGSSKVLNDISYFYRRGGELDRYELRDAKGALLQTTSNVYGVVRESLLLTETIVRNAGNGDSKSSTRNYDLNGNLKSLTMGEEVRMFLNDAEGRVLEKIELKGRTATSVLRTLVANGEVLGSSDSSLETFSTAYEPLIGGSGTENNPSVYVVQKDGDNLGSIAKAIWGNERLWYLIADANGLTGNETLKVGQALTIPQKAGTIYNDTTTFKPYDAAELIGNTTPELAIPQPAPQGKSKKCGGLGQLVMVVVAVVATVMTAGAAASALATAAGVTGGAAGVGSFAAAGMLAAGTSGLSAGMAIAAGAIGGAVGSIASQAVGIAIGAQDGFSWKGVALSAIGGGISAGVASAGMSGSLGALFEGAQTPGLVARAALSNVAAQAVGNVLGLQSGFNWRDVAASAAGAAVSSATTRALNNAGAFASLGDWGDLARSTVSGFAAGTAATIMRGGKIEFAR